MREKKRVTTPAEGEMRSAAGLYYQYSVAALLIFQHLKTDTLREIRFVDKEALTLDDFQIGGPSRLDAYQVKWSKFEGMITYKEFKTGSGQERSLFEQLLEGWKALRNKHPHLKIVVHLISNNIPSKNDRVISDKFPAPRHFAAFLREVWEEIQLSTNPIDFQVPAKWKEAWNELLGISQLQEEEFRDFMYSCEINLKFSIEERLRALQMIDSRSFREDIELIRNKIFGMVGPTLDTIILSKQELLVKLGWEKRYEIRNTHNFPISPLYQPNRESIEKFKHTLESLQGGYLAVLGSPGSGKSTMLTHTLNNTCGKIRLVRYYCFIPDANNPNNLRGESKNFFHDMVNQLNRIGIKVETDIKYEDRHAMMQIFYNQLQVLSQDSERKGLKTIILIDGLDHISREQNPERSFLLDLPEPSQVPKGVYIVLGSQTIELPDLANNVKSIIRQDERHMYMQPLKEETILKIIKRARIPYDITESQINHLMQLASGHPLALNYILNQLEYATNEEMIDKILCDTVDYRGDIERVYNYHWEKIRDNFLRVKLLGLLSRVKGAIDLEWLTSWFESPSEVEKFRREMAHYFRRKNNSNWNFFHNSFRLFLQKQTAQTADGMFYPELNLDYHRELAKRCSESLGNHKFDTIYHLFLAEEYEKILKQINQNNIIQQMEALRPFKSIELDIQLAKQAAIHIEDFEQMIYLMLLTNLIDSRYTNINSDLLFETLWDLKKIDILVQHILDDNRLLINNSQALKWSSKLYRAGYIEIANKIFELTNTGQIMIYDLGSWVNAALNISSIEEVIHAIKTRKKFPDEDERPFSPEYNIEEEENEAFYKAGLVLIEQNRVNELEKILLEFDIDSQEGQIRWLWLRVQLWEKNLNDGNWDQAERDFRDTIIKVEHWNLTAEAHGAIVRSFLIFNGREYATTWIEKFQDSIVVEDLSSNKHINIGTGNFLLGRNRWIDRFHFFQILTHFKVEPKIEKIQKPEFYAEKYMQFLFSLYDLAVSVTANESPIKLAKQLIIVFKRYTGYSMYQNTKDIKKSFEYLLLQCMFEIDPSILKELHELLDNEWKEAEGWNLLYSDQVYIICGISLDSTLHPWVKTQLKRIEGEFNSGSLGLYEAKDDLLYLTRMWNMIGAPQESERLLKLYSHMQTSMISQESFRVLNWGRFLTNIISKYPEITSEGLVFLTKAITKIGKYYFKSESAFDDDDILLIHEWISEIYRFSPAYSIYLVGWLEKLEIVTLDSAVSSILLTVLREFQFSLDLVINCFEKIVLKESSKIDSEPKDYIIELCLEALIQRIIERESHQEAIIVVSNLINKAEKYPLSLRNNYCIGQLKRALKILSEDKQESFVLVPTYSGSFFPDLVLSLKDGKHLSFEEITAKITSVNALIEMHKSSMVSSSFDWTPFVKTLVVKLNRNEILQLVDYFEDCMHIETRQSDKSDFAEILGILGRRLIDLKDIKSAGELAKRIIIVSQALYYEWSAKTFCEGICLLWHYDKKRSRELLWEYINKHDETELMRYIEKLVLLVITPEKYPIIWGMVKNHILELLKFYDLPIELLKAWNYELEHKTAEQVLYDFLDEYEKNKDY